MSLPPFYVGQKVVCVNNSDSSGATFSVSDYFTKHKEYTVLAIRLSCCGWEIDAGVRISNKPGWVKCMTCGVIEWDNGCDIFWVRSFRFVPVQESFQSITLEKVLEEETKLISVN